MTCVFSEPQFEQRLIAAIIEGTPVRFDTLDPLGANIENGPELYFSLLREMAASFNDCLAPADRKQMWAGTARPYRVRAVSSLSVATIGSAHACPNARRVVGQEGALPSLSPQGVESGRRALVDVFLGGVVGRDRVVSSPLLVNCGRTRRGPLTG